MRVFAIALAFGLMASGASFAQAPAPAPGTQKPAAPAPAPSTQKPALPAPAPAAPSTQKPAAPAPAAAAPTLPPAKFQDGLKYAYVRMDVIAAQSADGKAAADKLKAEQERRQRELQDKNKNLQAMQQKLDQGGSLLNDAARAQLQSDIERTQRDLQRSSEDAQEELQKLAQQVEEDFTRKVLPMVDRIAKEKQVHFVFNAGQSGLIWADPGMDLTGDVIAAMNTGGGGKPAAPAAPAAPAPPAR
jgi:Skp family chaperone for outer membrane proteins